MAEQLNRYEELKQVLTRKPFVPFTVVLNGGQRYEINERFQVAISERRIVIAPNYSAHESFPLSSVTGIELHEPAA